MHVHGHNMQILSSGLGYWDGSIVNPENPTRRDTWSLPPAGYAVMQWDLNNPGVWPVWCPSIVPSFSRLSRCSCAHIMFAR